MQFTCSWGRRSLSLECVLCRRSVYESKDMYYIYRRIIKKPGELLRFEDEKVTIYTRNKTKMIESKALNPQWGWQEKNVGGLWEIIFR